MENNACQPVLLDMPDHRLSHDNNPCMLDVFVQKYGNAGYVLWVTAPRAYAGAPQPGFVSECRRAYDGHSYTWKEFVDHYGQIIGSWFWVESPVVLPVLAPKADVLLPSGFWAAQEPLLAADVSQPGVSQPELQPAAEQRASTTVLLSLFVRHEESERS